MIEYYNKRYHSKYVLMSNSIIIGQKIYFRGEKISTKTLDKIIARYNLNHDALVMDDMLIYLYAEAMKRIATEKSRNADLDLIDNCIAQLIIACTDSIS
ncbi:hypothetical protein PVA45_07165 (plasmid) [Entomospira entomophila]|uniref:Uncharacterized protein n=1 Tax=Entomospira entomophila TaxID=2719988 RepID=A0A968GB96_9SPIO|nr:hypothetical protein [Entomospira entomophilus]NIZ41362.1 hypothetical protein [Entomospira entomophilus]WDI36227.1 hypothetical protein PVA45_07165 [Entomospira entomophilus]